jgi:hypothetical protein
MSPSTSTRSRPSTAATRIRRFLSDDCTFDGTAGHVGTGRDEILEALQQGRDSGWLSHNPIGTVAAGEFLVSIYGNHFADGTRITAAGGLRFNDDGEVTEMRSLDPR